MKPRLLLINPVNPTRTGLTINQGSRFPPLGSGIVAALTPDHWQVELVDENWTPFEFQQADLVGITAFTAAAPRAYQIAAAYRERGIPVVMGGIHATMCTDEALQYVDAVVCGEAEGIWPQVITDYEAGKLQPLYKGEWLPLCESPIIPRDLFHPDYSFASVQTSRGCPMNCEFCSVTAFNGRRYRRRSPEAVLDELERIPQKMVFFVDDNLIGYGERDRQAALALFKGMVERGIDKWWFTQASLNFGDDEEVLHWAQQAGCKMVFLGLEAEEVEGLAEVNKRLNLARGVRSYAQAFDRIHQAGIAVLGAFIYGLDSDTIESLQHRTEYMIHSGIDVMQTTYLTPLPGTRLFDQLQAQDRLLYTDFPSDWEHYDMTEVIHLPGQMSPNELERAMQTANRRMYAWPLLARKAFHTLCATRNKTAAMFAWSSNINYRNVAYSNRL